MEEGTVPSPLTIEVGDSEDQDLDQMEANLNDLTNSSILSTTRPNLASYLFDNTRFVILEKLKEDTHLQVPNCNEGC